MHSHNELTFDRQVTRLEAGRNNLSAEVKRNDRILIDLLFAFAAGVLIVIVQLINLNTTLTDIKTDISLIKSEIVQVKSDIDQLKSDMVQVKNHLEIL